MTLFIDCNNYLQSETLLKPKETMWPVMSCLDCLPHIWWNLLHTLCFLWNCCNERWSLLALLGLLIVFFCYNCLFLPFFRIVFQMLLPWWTFYTALFVYGKYYLIKNRNMAQIQGGHCPWSKIQGGQPTTLTPPCRAPESTSSHCLTSRDNWGDRECSVSACMPVRPWTKDRI